MAQASKRLKHLRRTKRRASVLERDTRHQAQLLDRYAVALYSILTALGGSITVPAETVGGVVPLLARLAFEVESNEADKTATFRLAVQQ